MRLIDLSFRQVAVGVLILGILNWAMFQFGFLPNMTEQERRDIHAGRMSTLVCMRFLLLWSVLPLGSSSRIGDAIRRSRR